MTELAIPAIETRYAGCRFRSRLEARWAVFFDALGIPWDYEPQGFAVSYRLSLSEGTFPYLPDFWLPDLGLWAEVKGSLADAECLRLLDAAAFLSTNGGMGCHDDGGNDLVILGPAPRPGRIVTSPWRLHMHKGILGAVPWRVTSERQPFGGSCPGIDIHVAGDYGGPLLSDVAEFADVPHFLLGGYGLADDSGRLGRAYAAARSARFEHGERPR